MRRNRDRDVRAAMEFDVPPLALQRIHDRAKAGAARARLRDCVVGVALVCAFMMSVNGASALTATTSHALPLADPRVPTPVASTTPLRRHEYGVMPIPMPVPAPAPPPAPTVS